MSAFNDGGYRIGRFNSTRSVLRDNQVSGNAEAGLYVGDSPDAETSVTDNRAWNNGYGVFVRHSHQVAVSDNEIWANCLGVLVFDDGHAGGVGDVKVTDNNVHGNNRFCPGSQGGPPLSGGGIDLVGAVRTLVADNDVDGNNHNGTPGSGGIVLLSASMVSGGSDVNNDTIRDNHARHNLPDDIVWDGSGYGNHFSDNECGASTPGHLCT